MSTKNNRSTNEKVSLYTETGTVNKLDELTDKLTPVWYWFEPDIAAYIGENVPVSTLKPWEKLTKKEPFQELLLFADTAGMTIIPNGSEYQYFYWREDNTSPEKEENNIACSKITTSAYKRTTEDLKKQYGLPKELFDGLPKAFNLSEYYDSNKQRIAWTITEKGA